MRGYMKVIKRDGRKKEFDESTIFKAIKAANNSKEYPIEKEKRITDDQIMEVVKWVVKKRTGTVISFYWETQNAKSFSFENSCSK